MSRWQELFNDHPIHNSLNELRSLIDGDEREPQQSTVAEKRRILKIIEVYEGVLSELDPEVVPFNHLDSLNNALRHANLWNEVASYLGNGNEAHLVNANNNLSNQLSHLGILVGVAGKVRSTEPTKSIQKLLDQLGKNLSGLGDEEKQLHQKVEELSSLIEKRREETNSQINEWQQQFSESQERRNEKYSEWAKSTADKAEKDFVGINKRYQSELESLLDDSEQKHKRILELYELTAGDSVAGGYLQNADKEGKQANFWRWAAIVFIILTASWLVCAYLFNTGVDDMGDIVWPKLIITLSLTGVLLYGVAYAAQQSTKHRINEKRTRWFALKVKAVDPFISSLNPEQRSELKRQLSERLFGHPSDEHESEPGVLDEHALKVVADAMAKVIKSIPGQ